MRRFLIAITLSLAARGLHAQEPAPGTRVRVTSSDPALRRSVLIVQSVRGDTLYALLQDGAIALPLAAATRVEVSQGRRRHRWRWAAIGGAAAGAASLGMLEILSATHPEYEDPTVLFGAMIVAPALMVTGIAAGALAAPLTEDWTTVVLGSAASVRRGTRVRVWSREAALSGAEMRVDTVRGGVYVLSQGGHTVEVPVRSVTRMEVWRGGGNRTATALRGSGIGAVAGTVYGLIATRVDGPVEGGNAQVVWRTAAAGAVLGTLWGAARPGGHWRPAPNASLALAPARGGGARLGIDVRF